MYDMLNLYTSMHALFDTHNSIPHFVYLVMKVDYDSLRE